MMSNTFFQGESKSIIDHRHRDFFAHGGSPFWSLQFSGWLGWIILFALRDAYWNQPIERSLMLVFDAGAGFLLTTMLRYCYQLVWNLSIATRAITILLASLFTALIWQPIKNFSQIVYLSEYQSVYEFGISSYFAGVLGYSYFVILCWSGLYFGLKFYRLLVVETQRSIRAESAVIGAQLQMLRYQLNPHFLFNTLNAISTLIVVKDAIRADAMLHKLSEFLRYSLNDQPMGLVTLENELKATQLYLDIEKVRFAERLKVVTRIEEQVLEAEVPSLIFQPLVENAIKFAVVDREAGGLVVLSAQLEDKTLVLKVSDDGPGLDPVMMPEPATGDVEPGDSGVGLKNTRKRLIYLYGEDGQLEFSRADLGGLCVCVRLPFVKVM
ncbi:MAG: histidine kinase [Pseudomonadales bacterium]|nr:histidine kinase [Pseudomonadales bacterium]